MIWETITAEHGHPEELLHLVDQDLTEEVAHLQRRALSRGHAEGSLNGKQWQPRDLASELYDAGWTGADNLLVALMVTLSESQGYDRAQNLNYNDQGVVTSKDCGVMQINIDASLIGTDAEERLYDVPTNIAEGRKKFEARGFQPWFGYTLNVYLRDTYLKRAVRGMGNFLADKMLAVTPTDTLGGSPYQHKLTTPLLDFEYRVHTLTAGNMAARNKALYMKRYVTSPANKDRLDEIAKILTTAQNDAKL